MLPAMNDAVSFASSCIVEAQLEDVGFTLALHAASGGGHTEVVRLLIQHGAEVDKVDDEGKTALMFAAEKGYKDVVEHLVEAGAGINNACEKGLTALHLASERGNISIVEHLVEVGAEINRSSAKGHTPLYFASQYGHADVVRYLIESRVAQKKGEPGEEAEGGSVLAAFGGMDDCKRSTEAIRFFSHKQNRFVTRLCGLEEAPRLPESIHASTAISWKDKVFLLGGYKNAEFGAVSWVQELDMKSFK